MKRPRDTHLKTKRRRLALGLLLTLTAGVALAGWQARCATDPTRVGPIPMPAGVELRSGDIILAGGVSLQSRLVRRLTDDNTYSHVGMIEATPQGLFVIHAAPEGPGDGGVGERVAKIPLSLFLAERGYVAVQVMRLQAQDAASREAAEDACNNALAYAEQAVPFDSAFDLANDQTIYCSELVYLAYKQAGEAWPDTLIGHYDNVMVRGPGITPGAFARAASLKTIWQHQPERTIR